MIESHPVFEVEHVFSTVDTVFYANAPHSNSAGNYSWGFLDGLDFAINKQTNLQCDNLKYTSTKSKSGRLSLIALR